MGYNITATRYLSGHLTLNSETAARLDRQFKKAKRSLPECCFLDNVVDAEVDPETDVAINHPWWNGEGSGYAIEELEEVLKHTKGTAELLLVWERGDSLTGYRVEDGKVSKRKVKITLE